MRTLRLLVGVGSAFAPVAASSAVAAPPETSKDLPAALAAIADRPRAIEFALPAAKSSEFKLPAGGHLQGIQSRYDATEKAQTLFIAHDSLTEAYFIAVRAPDANAQGVSQVGKVEHVQRLPSDGASPPLRHAGGIQLLDDVLAIGVEDNQAKLRSQIQFWNVAVAASPRQLSHLTILRQSDRPKVATAGAVGMVQTGERYLLAVGNWDCRAIDFYESNGKPLADPACRFEPASRWLADEADTSNWRPDTIRGTYQAINLLPGDGGKVYLLGLDTTLAGQDVVDVFTVARNQPAAQMLVKIARQPVALAEGCHFRFAGGAAFVDRKLRLLASPRNFAATTRLSVSP